MQLTKPCLARIQLKSMIHIMTFVMWNQLFFANFLAFFSFSESLALLVLVVFSFLSLFFLTLLSNFGSFSVVSFGATSPRTEPALDDLVISDGDGAVAVEILLPEDGISFGGPASPTTVLDFTGVFFKGVAGVPGLDETWEASKKPVVSSKFSTTRLMSSSQGLR